MNPTPQVSSPEPKLFERILKAGLWTVGTHATEAATRLLSTLILSRLLFPEAFGLVAAATSIFIGLALVSDFGVRTVILQNPGGDQERFLRTAWTFQVLRGLGLWLMLVVVCALIGLPAVRNVIPAGSVFANPQFPFITAALGFGLVLSGLESTASHLNVRRLNFRQLYFLDLAARIVPLPVMIIWAWTAPNVWALVAGAMVGGVVRLILSHALLPGPQMRFQWDQAHLREIVRFGRWINASSVATFISGQSDRLILGLFFPGLLFGLFSIARTLIDTSQGLFERLNGALALPALGEIIRRDHRDLKDRYYRFRLPFDVAAPLLGGILVSTGSVIVSLLFDARYAAAGPMLQILAVGLVTYPSLLIGSAFTASGAPHVGALVSVIQATSLIGCMAIGFLMAGPVGSLWGIALHKIFPAAAILLIAHRRKWVDVRKELRVLPVFVAGLLAGQAALVLARTMGIAGSLN